MVAYNDIACSILYVYPRVMRLNKFIRALARSFVRSIVHLLTLVNFPLIV